MYKLLYILTIILCSVLNRGNISYAQSLKGQETADSLIAELAKQKEDSNRVALLLKISEAYAIVDLNKSIQYKYDALDMARKLKMDNKTVEIYLSLGRVYFKTFDSSYYYARKAIEVSKKLNNSNLLADAYYDMGILLGTGGNISGRESQHTINEDGLLYLDSAISIYNKINNVASCIEAISRKAEVLMFLDRYKDAKESLRQAESMTKDLVSPDDPSLQAIYARTAMIYKETGEDDSVLLYYQKALHLAEKGDNIHRIAYFKSTVAVAYAKLGLFNKAIETAKSGLDLSDNKLYLKERLDNILALYEIYKEKGDYKNALKYYETLFHITDSLNASNLKESMSQFNAQLEAEKNKKKIALLLKDKEISESFAARQRTIFIALAIGITLVILLAIVLYNRYQIKQRALAASEKHNEIITKEKEKSDELLLNILPEEVTHDLKERGATTAQQFDHVTVMFTDFVAFTRAGERMGSQALVEELHNCFKAFDQILDKYDIEKIKTIGDAYLAVCGLPTPSTGHAEKVVNAASDIISFMQDRRKELGDKTFEVRIGIHSGEVVAGIVGVKKFAYDIWGDTVNTAARMEQNSEPGKINISQTTYELVKGKFTCTYRGEHEAKNKGKLKMYFVEV